MIITLRRRKNILPGEHVSDDCSNKIPAGHDRKERGLLVLRCPLRPHCRHSLKHMKLYYKVVLLCGSLQQNKIGGSEGIYKLINSKFLPGK